MSPPYSGPKNMPNMKPAGLHQIHQMKNISTIPYDKQEFMGRTFSLFSFDKIRTSYKTKLTLFLVMLHVFFAARTCLSGRCPATVRKRDTKTDERDL
jgi:hypothetical protein